MAREGGAVEGGQGGELGLVVAAEVAEEILVGTQLPELADQLHGDDLTISQRGRWPTLAEAAEVQGLQFVVHEAEYLKQEFLRGHGGFSFSTEWYPLM